MWTAPEALHERHRLDDFDCGVATVNDWLKRRALGADAHNAARTFVCREASRVIAYYSLRIGAVAASAAHARFRGNMPDPITVFVLAPVAITRSYQRRGLGRALFHDAARRVVRAADAIGIRGLLAPALSAEAKAFYLHMGLEVSPLGSMTLMAGIASLCAALD